jgi:hypothetical protein
VRHPGQLPVRQWRTLTIPDAGLNFGSYAIFAVSMLKPDLFDVDNFSSSITIFMMLDSNDIISIS